MQNDGYLLLILPEDHVIQDEGTFTKAVSDAIPLAESGKLIKLEIVADRPYTGCGYIKRSAAQSVNFILDKFVEKSSIEIAQDYAPSCKYYWNSGVPSLR
jgi:mannose-1-phosphate guanylyltransferase